jgi:transposase
MSFPAKKSTVRKSRIVKTEPSLDCDLQSLPMNVARYGVGFDVHKHQIAVCVKAQLKDATIILVKDHTFSAYPAGIQELMHFLTKFKPISHYLMECTGVYHLPLFHALCKQFPEDEQRIVAMNPLMVNRRLTEFGNKHDKADAERMADLTFYDQLVKPSYIGNQMFFQLRHLIRTHQKSRKQMTLLKNRIQCSLDSCNQKFPWNLSHEWCVDLLNWYSSRDWTLQNAYDAYLDFCQKAKKPTKVMLHQQKHVAQFGDIILDTETRFSIQMDLLRMIYEDMISGLVLKRVEESILKDVELHEVYNKLCAVPSLGTVTVLIILLELGDYHRFNNVKAFLKFCGVVPSIAQSADQIQRKRLNRNSNSNIRNALTQAATILLCHSESLSDLARYANQMYRVKGMPFKKAMVKVAHKLGQIIYNILVLKLDYDPSFQTQQQNGQIAIKKAILKKSNLEPARIRGLRRDIQTFLISNSEFLNSDVRHHLVEGFSQVLRKLKKSEKDTKEER